MNFAERRVLFITPFYMLLQFFLIKYLVLLIYPVNDVFIVPVVCLIGVDHFAPMLFESKKSRRISRFLTAVDGVWMWATVFFLIDVVVIYIIKMFVNPPFGIIVLLLAVVPVLGVYNYHKAHKLTVNEKTLKLKNLSEDINIVHFSDVHFGSIRHKQIIRQISDKLQELDETCDVAIISGDLADGSSAVDEDDFLEFKNVKMPIIFTPGNHDFYRGIENVIKACKKAGIIVLDNEGMKFKNLNIYGLTFSFENRDAPSLSETLINPDMVNIINYHVPYHWSQFSSLGFDIQLSGHTHGGQFYPAVNFSEILFKYNKGLFKNDDEKFLHVTTGVGSMGTPMRWGTDSELVILKLRKL